MPTVDRAYRFRAMLPTPERLLSIKELAFALSRHRNYVSRMRPNGFVMPGGKATVSEARAWLARIPAPGSRTAWAAAA